MNYRRHRPDLSHLGVKPEAAEAYEELGIALDKQRGLCFERPGLWTDKAGNPRARLVAKTVCGRCPVLEQCNAYAQLEKPEGPIVQGGEFYPETEVDDV